MKRAQFGKVAGMILIMVSLIVLIFFLVKVIATTNSIVEDSECKSSIATHVTAQKTTSGDVVTNIVCPTKYNTIETNSEDDAKRALAESLKTCWGTWGRGELQLYARDNLYCAVCSVSEFENKNMKINDFAAYLATQTPIESSSDQTYAQYLKFYQTDRANKEIVEQLSQTTMEIDTSKKYAAIFVYAKGSDEIKEFIQILTPETVSGGAKEGIAIGAIVGVGAAYGASALGIISGPIGWATIIGGAAFTGLTGGAAYGFIAGNNPDFISSPILIEYNADSLAKLGCKEIAVSQDSQKEKLG